MPHGWYGTTTNPKGTTMQISNTEEAYDHATIEAKALAWAEAEDLV